jgi:hypothetical protein
MEKLIEKIGQLKKAVVSLREFKAQKHKDDDKKMHEHMKAIGSDIDGQIKHAMCTGMDEHGNVPAPAPKKKTKLALVKALEDAGFRESALLLKNWDMYDATATEFNKTLE